MDDLQGRSPALRCLHSDRTARPIASTTALAAARVRAERVARSSSSMALCRVNVASANSASRARISVSAVSNWTSARAAITSERASSAAAVAASFSGAGPSRKPHRSYWRRRNTVSEASKRAVAWRSSRRISALWVPECSRLAVRDCSEWETTDPSSVPAMAMTPVKNSNALSPHLCGPVASPVTRSTCPGLTRPTRGRRRAVRRTRYRLYLRLVHDMRNARGGRLSPKTATAPVLRPFDRNRRPPA